MGYLSLLLIAVGLCFDTFAVSVSCGLLKKKIHLSHTFRIALIFAIVQAIMPLVGWMFGYLVEPYVAAYDHWVAFGMLGAIGGKMIYESLRNKKKDNTDACSCMSLKETLGMAVATSIDALIVGVSIAFIQLEKLKLFIFIFMIMLVTGVSAVFGIWVGKRFGHKFERQAEFIGGLLLVLIGLKVLLEHTVFAE